MIEELEERAEGGPPELVGVTTVFREEEDEDAMPIGLNLRTNSVV